MRSSLFFSCTFSSGSSVANGRRGPKQIIGCFVHNTLSRERGAGGFPCISGERLHGKNFLFLALDILLPSRKKEKKVLVSSATLCRASLIQNKLTERLRRQRSQPSFPPHFFLRESVQRVSLELTARKVFALFTTGMKVHAFKVILFDEVTITFHKI
mgnify:CR=1 FL=1